ncbi:putative DNA adenine methyltransferase [Pseudomonas phage PspYZU05]|uniref:site-specific DNA-methyltransferase (adenine-specific) n=1 Tax=Pseudomonas phage PspYZU05 TaxID=1983556 RepID=A0A2U7NBY4_9CAUD|nr:putative DNA adenine methyltransferase [Pseudomonas phage PspYZU05]ASD52159.1 putative DNA adenine methyltransferase [Pseudomonas phage PspYZU05]
MKNATGTNIANGVICYVGNKQKLLSKLLPLFPEYSRFVDLFCGGLSVSLNVKGNVLANDIEKPLIDMYEALRTTSEEEIHTLIETMNLDKTNVLAYRKAVQRYNKFREPLVLYALIQHSFSNMLRFNDGRFNVSFGNRTVTRNTYRRLAHFHENQSRIEFSSKHYSEIEIKPGDFVYVDPPYLITKAAYNCYWSDEEEQKLLEYLDSLHQKGIKFGLSNVVRHKGRENKYLLSWMTKYNVVKLDKTYVMKGKTCAKDTEEVYIHN